MKKMSALAKALVQMMRELKAKGKYPLKRDKQGRLMRP
jgi:hypothetical protein